MLPRPLGDDKLSLLSQITTTPGRPCKYRKSHSENSASKTHQTMSSNPKLELPPPIQNRNARNKAEQTRDDKKNQNQKEKEPTATTNNWTSECQRQDWHFLSHRRESKSTTPSNATILRAANVHFENGFVSSHSTQKRKRENFKTIPPRPPYHLKKKPKKPKKPKKKKKNLKPKRPGKK